MTNVQSISHAIVMRAAKEVARIVGGKEEAPVRAEHIAAAGRAIAVFAQYSHLFEGELRGAGMLLSLGAMVDTFKSVADTSSERIEARLSEDRCPSCTGDSPIPGPGCCTTWWHKIREARYQAAVSEAQIKELEQTVHKLAHMLDLHREELSEIAGVCKVHGANHPAGLACSVRVLAGEQLGRPQKNKQGSDQ